MRVAVEPALDAVQELLSGGDHDVVCVAHSFIDDLETPVAVPSRRPLATRSQSSRTTTTTIHPSTPSKPKPKHSSSDSLLDETDPIGSFLAIICHPVATHLAPQFHNAGISTADDLVGIAHWPEERLALFVRKNLVKRKNDEASLFGGFKVISVSCFSSMRASSSFVAGIGDLREREF